jgi:hypothetical protein
MRFAIVLGLLACASAPVRPSQQALSLHQRRPGIEFRMQPSRVEVNEAWGWAAEQGEFFERWTESDGPVELRGPYYGLWQREGDRWRLKSLSFAGTDCRGGAYCR